MNPDNCERTTDVRSTASRRDFTGTHQCTLTARWIAQTDPFEPDNKVRVCTQHKNQLVACSPRATVEPIAQ